MKILMLSGSPHPSGTTDLLAATFAEAARAAGHDVDRINCAKLKLHACLGCDHCRRNDGRCVWQDDMLTVISLLKKADLVVFATPLYYFGMTAQLKLVVDRFYAINSLLRERQMKSILLAACGDKDEWAMDALVSHYETICRYLKWEDVGQVLAIGCYVRDDITGSAYLEQAATLAGGL